MKPSYVPEKDDRVVFKDEQHFLHNERGTVCYLLTGASQVVLDKGGNIITANRNLKKLVKKKTS